MQPHHILHKYESAKRSHTHPKKASTSELLFSTMGSCCDPSGCAAEVAEGVEGVCCASSGVGLLTSHHFTVLYLYGVREGALEHEMTHLNEALK